MAAHSAQNMITSHNYRDDFPVLSSTMNDKPLVFLDTAASAQKPRAVIEAMDNVLNSGYSNIHRGLYRISQGLTADFEAVRSKIAKFIGANSEKEVVFTRNATEGINLVAQTWGRTHLKFGDEIILTEMEHHANIVPWQLLQKEIGFTIKVIPVLNNGSLDLEAFDDLLSEKTKLVACVQISNAFGIINSVNKIIEMVRKVNQKTKVLVDGSQAIVHGPVDVSGMDADFYVFTGHKLYGPTGIGVLYGKHSLLIEMPPYQGGGDMIERVSFSGSTFKEPPYRFEAGTPPIVEVIGLGAAIDYLENVGYDYIASHESQLRDYGHEILSEIDGLRLYGLGNEKAAIFSFTIEDTHPSDIGMILDQCGVAVRAGHHCCMPLMQRFGLDATVRASVGLYSSRDDINQFYEAVLKAKDMLK